MPIGILLWIIVLVVLGIGAMGSTAWILIPGVIYSMYCQGLQEDYNIHLISGWEFFKKGALATLLLFSICFVPIAWDEYQNHREREERMERVRRSYSNPNTDIVDVNK